MGWCGGGLGCPGNVELPVPAGVKQTLRTQHSGLFRLGHTSVVLQVRIQDGKLGAESGNDLGSRDLDHPEAGPWDWAGRMEPDAHWGAGTWQKCSMTLTTGDPTSLFLSHWFPISS